jgi:hypothetical protein
MLLLFCQQQDVVRSDKRRFYVKRESGALPCGCPAPSHLAAAQWGPGYDTTPRTRRTPHTTAVIGFFYTQLLPTIFRNRDTNGKDIYIYQIFLYSILHPPTHTQKLPLPLYPLEIALY